MRWRLGRQAHLRGDVLLAKLQLVRDFARGLRHAAQLQLDQLPLSGSVNRLRLLLAQNQVGLALPGSCPLTATASHLKVFDVLDSIVESDDFRLPSAQSQKLRHRTLLALREHLAITRRTHPLIEATEIITSALNRRGADVAKYHRHLLCLASCLPLLPLARLFVRLFHQFHTLLMQLLVLVAE